MQLSYLPFSRMGINLRKRSWPIALEEAGGKRQRKAKQLCCRLTMPPGFAYLAGVAADVGKVEHCASTCPGLAIGLGSKTQRRERIGEFR